jgi:hypothetical protein
MLSIISTGTWVVKNLRLAGIFIGNFKQIPILNDVIGALLLCGEGQTREQETYWASPSVELILRQRARHDDGRGSALVSM